MNAFANLNESKCDNLITQAEEIIKNESVPGMAIAVIDYDQTLCKKFYGEVSQDGKKIASDTIFPIASLTKGFLGSLLAIMSDQKQFNWDLVASKELKEFKLKNPDYTKILSFHHIASMQTGLPEFAAKEYLKNTNNRQEILKSFSLVDSIYPPGIGKFSYQYALLAAFEEMIKKRTGQEWEKLLQKKILEPLKLVNTGVDITLLNDKSNVAITYDENNIEIDWEQFKVTSAASMYSSLNDMIKWARLHLQNGKIGHKQLISKSEMGQMQTSYSIIEDTKYLFLDMDNVSELSYGRFWRNYQYKGFKVIEHNGVSSGSSSIICYIPAKKLAIVILSTKLTSAPSLIRTKFLQLISEK
jgi:CubicO group peptidase (beta-lactamase class C family)